MHGDWHRNCYAKRAMSTQTQNMSTVPLAYLESMEMIDEAIVRAKAKLAKATSPEERKEAKQLLSHLHDWNYWND
jgi:hypothetical protein